MPSSACNTFIGQIHAVRQLFDESSERETRLKKRVGPKSEKIKNDEVNTFSSAAQVLLCASWEAYVEEVLVEYFFQAKNGIVAQCDGDFKKLPKKTQEALSCELFGKESDAIKNKFVNINWKDILKAFLERDTSGWTNNNDKHEKGLDTPTSGKIGGLYAKYLENPFHKDANNEFDSTLINKINDMVGRRHLLAHKGWREKFSLQVVETDIINTCKAVAIIDEFLSEQLGAKRIKPWSRTKTHDKLKSDWRMI